MNNKKENISKIAKLETIKSLIKKCIEKSNIQYNSMVDIQEKHMVKQKVFEDKANEYSVDTNYYK